MGRWHECSGYLPEFWDGESGFLVTGDGGSLWGAHGMRGLIVCTVYGPLHDEMMIST